MPHDLWQVGQVGTMSRDSGNSEGTRNKTHVVTCFKMLERGRIVFCESDRPEFRSPYLQVPFSCNLQVVMA